MRTFPRLLCGLLVFGGSALLGSVVTAQTADGVGAGPDRTEDALTRDAGKEAEDLARLATFEPKFFQFSLRGGPVYVPPFVLDSFFAAHTNMWEKDAANFSYGAEFTLRNPKKYDLTVGVDMVDLHTPDGFWLEDGDPIRDADWTTSDLKLLDADVQFTWNKSLTDKERVDWYYGFGIGAAVKLGHFYQRDIDYAACDIPESFNGQDEAATTLFGRSKDESLLTRCLDPDTGDPYIKMNEPKDDNKKIPPALPLLSALTGFRFYLAEHFALDVEAGMKIPYFFAGLELGYRWHTNPKL